MKVLAILLLLLSIKLVRASEKKEGSNQKVALTGLYLKSHLLDTRDIFISPLKWNKKQLITASAIIGTTGFLFTQDRNIQQFSQKNRTAFTENISAYGLEPWAGYYAFGTMGLYYLHGELFNNERSKRVSLLLLKTYAVTGLVVRIPKMVFGRHRPYNNTPADPFVWEGLKGNKTSFVSGHTTCAFALATIFAQEYKDKKWVQILAYSIASCAGLSRIHDNKHWASDVLGGAAIGYAMGKLIYIKNNWNVNLSITPAIAPISSL